MSEANNQTQLKKLKEELVLVKQQVKEQAVHESLLAAAIFNQKQREVQQRHHLFDAIDEEPENFTAKDLEDRERGTPKGAAKFSNSLQQELTSTIGRRKANRM
jgi:hypothetical protein